jgi:hypothetical protein
MKVKIIKSSGARFWYAKKIGEIFDVVRTNKEEKTYTVDNGNQIHAFLVNFDDCEILKP